MSKKSKKISNIFKKALECDLNSEKAGSLAFLFFFNTSIIFGVLFSLSTIAVSHGGIDYSKIKKIVPSGQEVKIKKMVKGYPIEKMVKRISQKNKEVSSFLIAIAKKESNWGKYSPKKDGKECYNYWGYRGSYNQTESGYSCFDSPEQAVEVVGSRISDLIDEEINTPKKMIVWKCGSNCEGHSEESVEKWIDDVELYLNKMSSL